AGVSPPSPPRILPAPPQHKAPPGRDRMGLWWRNEDPLKRTRPPGVIPRGLVDIRTLAQTYSSAESARSTMGAKRLNFCVRDGNRWTLLLYAPRKIVQSNHILLRGVKHHDRVTAMRLTGLKPCRFDHHGS